jgi:hypothetical protein
MGETTLHEGCRPMLWLEKEGQASPMVRSVKTGWYLAPICTGFLTAMILPAR